MDYTDQLNQLIQYTEEIRTSVLVIRHFLGLLSGFVIGWIWFHDF